jgi:phosphatidylglycerol:prolipoprotein diacylglycerol transferase
VRSTLFYIPAEWLGWPVFGLGWLLALWLIGWGVTVARLARKPGGWTEIQSLLPLMLVGAVAIAGLLPGLVEYGVDGRPLGLPIRGYGVMLMLATLVAVAVAAQRARAVGIHPDLIYSLAFVMFVAGLVGARLFFIVEYWRQFVPPGGPSNLWATAKAMLNLAQGGLVVYGSVLLGVPAGAWFCWRRGLPLLAMGDLIAPSMALGLAIGRLGCFLNGCCFGGVCLDQPYAVRFPAGSPPYFQHQQQGWQSGVWVEARQGQVVVAYLDPEGAAGRGGLRVGDRLVTIDGHAVTSVAEARRQLARGGPAWTATTEDGRIVRWQSLSGPARSVPVHPAQLYAAIDAALLALLLWAWYPLRRRDGELFALLLLLHPVSRFLLEMIRTDEPGQFGTSLSISQWLSALLFLAGLALAAYLVRQPRGVLKQVAVAAA